MNDLVRLNERRELRNLGSPRATLERWIQHRLPSNHAIMVAASLEHIYEIHIIIECEKFTLYKGKYNYGADDAIAISMIIPVILELITLLLLNYYNYYNYYFE